MEGPVGFEPTTPGLKVRSSTAELQALASMLAGSWTRDNVALPALSSRWEARGMEPDISEVLPAVYPR